MFVQTVLEEIKIKAEYPSFRFLFMFLGLLSGAVFATAISDFSVLPQPSLAWSFLAVALFLLSSLVLMFWNNAANLSLSPVIARRRV